MAASSMTAVARVLMVGLLIHFALQMAKHEAIYQEHGFETLPLFHSGQKVEIEHVLAPVDDDNPSIFKHVFGSSDLSATMSRPLLLPLADCFS